MADDNADNSADHDAPDAPPPSASSDSQGAEPGARNNRGGAAKNEEWRWAADSSQSELRNGAERSDDRKGAGWRSATGEELLSVGEAAERAGVHANTVRRYLKSEGLPFFLRDMTNGNVVSGSLPENQWPGRYQYLVPARVVPYLAAEAGDEVSAGPASSPEASPATEDEAVELEAGDLRASLDSAQQELAAAEEQLASLRGERDWLRLHLRDITAFLPAAKEEAESARSELELAREATDRERERAEEIRRTADELTREKDREIRARDLAVIRWQSLSWWARRGTNLEAIISEELERLSATE